MTDIDSKVSYIVVLNGEEQYSILRADSEIPPGWDVEGFRGARQDCLDHIDVVWTDMRPLSVRRRQDGQ
ncbi:MbtH family protein [Micromonospora sp. NPDC048898]|uniref:MbtH family protein n=1 Tax=Micromonospora sp. NPDC048898 TaxID=3364260 RepID=UPI003715D050